MGNRGYKLLVVLSLIFCQNVYCQIVVKGKVTDALNLPLAYATVTTYSPFSRIEANTNGEFTLNLPEGNQNIDISFVGYKTKALKLAVYKNMPPVKIKLECGIALNEVEVLGEYNKYNLNTPMMGIHFLKSSDIRKKPSLLGEADVLKSIQLAAGVQSTSEGNTGFSVRGGAPDQNLILLDHTIVYNPSHLIGFLSVFNNDIVKDATLYKSYVPVKYGGRLASTLEISTIDEHPQKLTMVGGIGLLASRLSLVVPCGTQTGLLLSARRSYADLFLKLLPNENAKKSSLYFYDLNLKLTHHISDKDFISLTTYSGRDHVAVEDFGINYGNQLLSFIWRHDYNSKIYSTAKIAFSKYRYDLKSDWEINLIEWKSNLFDVNGEIDFCHRLNERNKLSYGISSTKHAFHPCTVEGPNSWGYEVSESYASESAIYLANEQAINNKWIVSYGLRSNFFNNECSYITIDPRLSSVIKLSKESSIKMSYGQNTQFLQWASRSDSGSPLDVWFPATAKIKPQKTFIISTGYYRNIPPSGIETSIEIYYRGSHNIIDFADNVNLLFNDHIEDLVCSGSGKAYGLELGVSKKTKRFTTIINYTYSHAEFTIPEINKGKTYLSPYDKPHSVNLFIDYKASKKINVSANWMYSSGKPGTFPSAGYETDGVYVPVYSGRNNYRYPDYHRLDFSFNYQPTRKDKRWKDEWNFSIYNAYARRNPWAINFKKGKSTMVYLFSAVPSITYNFKF